ncbi:hypothetical protein U9078_06620 [Escherichia coli]
MENQRGKYVSYEKDYNKYDVYITICCIFIRSTSPSTIVRKNNLFFYRYEWVYRLSERRGKLYTHILTLDNPEEIFKNIIENRKSTKESKIYAACGLYYLNVENIESLFNENDKQEYMSVLRGDILTKIKLNDILNSVIINGCNTKLISEHK